MSHHKAGENKDKKIASEPDKDAGAKAAEGSESGDDKDVEGHNLFQMSDYYVQSKTGRQADIDRSARQSAQVKEARKNKPESR
jgi:hypothetical protein